MLHNVKVTTLNTTLQLLVIYRFWTLRESQVFFFTTQSDGLNCAQNQLHRPIRKHPSIFKERNSKKRVSRIAFKCCYFIKFYLEKIASGHSHVIFLFFFCSGGVGPTFKTWSY